MKFTNDFVNSLNTMHERPIEVRKRAVCIFNLGVIGLSFLIFILGGELIVSFIILYPMYKISNELFKSDIPFDKRWGIIFLKLMINLFIILILINILEFTIPSIKSILYYKL